MHYWHQLTTWVTWAIYARDFALIGEHWQERQTHLSSAWHCIITIPLWPSSLSAQANGLYGQHLLVFGFSAALSPHPQYIPLSLSWHPLILSTFTSFFHVQWHFIEHSPPKSLCKYRVVSLHFKKLAWYMVWLHSAITYDLCLEHSRLQAPVCTASCYLASN